MASTKTLTTTHPTLTLESEAPKEPTHLPTPSENKLPKKRKVPVFTDKYEERKWAKAQMAAAFRVFAKLGFADGCAGHVSLRGSSDVGAELKILWDAID